MSRVGFLLILNYIHFCHNDTSNTNDRLYKLRYLVTIVTPNFQKYLKLGEKLVFDESGLPFFRQYITNKRHKYGVKVYKLCTDEGYIYNFKWRERKNVLMLTTIENHDLSLVNTGKVRKHVGVTKTQCVLYYNAAKKWVNISDQMSSYYSVLRKTQKWYEIVAFELLFGAATRNYWLLFKAKRVLHHYLQFKEIPAKCFVAGETQLERPRALRRIHTLAEGVPKKRRKCCGCYEKLRRVMTSRDADNK
ncbi:hypothetical protein PR048_005264, partial [Dryococelus australis]